MYCVRTELDDSERNTTQTKSKEQSSSDRDLTSSAREILDTNIREFDPGSG